MAGADRLLAAFRDALDSGKAPDPALGAWLAGACERGRAAHPALAVSDEVFVRHVARLGRPEERGGPLGLEGLAVEDLYLACACAEQVAGAAEALRAQYGATIRTAIARYVLGSDVGEVEQRLLDGLLVGGGPERPRPRIASYAGLAPLDRWLQVAAQRDALMWLRAQQAEGRAREAAAAEAQLEVDTHPEVAYLKQRYRGEFAGALEAALGRVGARDRVLLRLQLVSGLSVEKIGKMFGVSQPTASRWLAQAREALLDDVKTELRRRLGTSSEELASLAGLVASRIDLSLSQLLKTR